MPSAREFIKGLVTQGASSPKGTIMFLLLLRALEREDYSLWGSVQRHNHHYVHRRSVSVELEADMPESMDLLVNKLQDYVGGMVEDLNRELERELENEYESRTEDEYVSDSLDTNEMYFDKDTGDEINYGAYSLINALPKRIAQKVLAAQADLFSRTPEQVFQDLMKRKVLFDDEGEVADLSNAVVVDDLEEPLKTKVLDRYRYWGVEDNDWSSFIEDAWKERLAKMGFNRVEIAYSLGGAQGDGASFTSDSIDGKQLLKYLLKRTESTQEAQEVARRVLGG